jgi:glutamyl-tRNA synthetase
LIDEGKAYRCYCTPEKLEAEREAARAAGRPWIYSGRCRTRTDRPDGPFAIRLIVRSEGETVIEDAVRGTVRWENALQGDHVVVRSDGSPTYQFANPVDDIATGSQHRHPR